jgi:hypothetical protein
MGNKEHYKWRENELKMKIDTIKEEATHGKPQKKDETETKKQWKSTPAD